MDSYDINGVITTTADRYAVDGTKLSAPHYDISGNILDHSQSGENEPNSYYYENSWLQNVISEINKRKNAIKNGCAYIFVTDIHIEHNSLQSPLVIKKIMDNTGIDVCIFGGDILKTRASGSTYQSGVNHENLTLYKEKFQNVVGADRWYAVRGNHDIWQYTGESGTSAGWTESDSFTIDFMFSHMHSNSKVHINNGCGYYWFDQGDTRFVVIDTFSTTKNTSLGRKYSVTMSDTQLQWLIDTLMGCNEKNVVMVSHFRHYEEGMPGTNVDALVKAFNNKSTFSTDTLSADFGACTGKFRYWLAGHSHADYYGSWGGLKYRQTESDARYHIGASPVEGRELGKIQEIAFDVDFVNYDTNTLTMFRVGYKYNSTSTTSTRSLSI